jgi:arylsulfatase A-like enzyme
MPDKTKTWNFQDHFREESVGANWTALPEFFRKNGYFTTGAGKVYHGGKPPRFDEEKSWSENWPGDLGACECGGHGFPPGGQATCEGLDDSKTSCQDDDISRIVIDKLSMASNGTLGNGSQPWFIAVGLHKPHISFYAKREHFALYPNPDPPSPLMPPEDMPYCAWHSCLSRAPGQNYSDWGNFNDIPNDMTLTHPMNLATAGRLRRGYYGSVTYADSNVGRILAAAEPLLHDTVVMLVGDHGWSLGEQNVWCKMTNFENGVRVPLIVRAPWAQAKSGMRVSTPVEQIDMYRTLADLSGIGNDKVESGVDGKSLMPLMTNTAQRLAQVGARSQFPRCYSALKNASNPSNLPSLDRVDCQDIPREQFDLMGYSLRTVTWRVTEWRVWNGATLSARWDLPPNATELYFHGQDPLKSGVDPFATETENVAGDPKYQTLLTKLRRQLRRAFAVTPGEIII